MNKKDSNKLLSPSSAIENYFDNLLQEDCDETVATKQAVVNNSLLILPGLEAELSKLSQTRFKRDIEIPETESKQPDDQDTNRLEDISELAHYSERIKFPIQCLMFYVNDTQLSIPLIELLSVVSNVDNLTRLPRTPQWFLGLLQHRDSNIKIADSARLLSIHNQKDFNTDHHVLVLKDANWGITCDRLGEIIQLDADDVKWSMPGSAGLALGTIKKRLAMLLDPEKILYRLNNENINNEVKNSAPV